MLARHKNLVFDPEDVKCVEMAEFNGGRQDIVLHLRRGQYTPRLKHATQEDFDAIWSIVSAPRGKSSSEKEHVRAVD